MLHKILLSMGFCFGLVACGGGSSSSGSNSPNQPSTQTGVFLDSPVSNIGYRTETLEGVTNSLGEYEYIEGETVTFFIGDLELPSVVAKGTVTPLDLAGSDDTSNSTVVNIIRLLQSLDENGNPSDGITITEIAKNSATQVDFTLSVSDFESSTGVVNLVENSGSTNVALVSESDAISHFESTLDENFSINMNGRTATSIMTYSECPSVPGGYSYSFTNTAITASGSDGWQTPACTLNESGSFSLTVSDLDSEYDLPFNCATYPVCTMDDFVKTLSGTDDDNREYTSTYTFNRASLTLTYVKSVNTLGQDETFTEIITIQ